MANAWSMAYLEFPGISPFLIQSTEFSSLPKTPEIETETEVPAHPAPALQFTKPLPTPDLIMASLEADGTGVKCPMFEETEALSIETPVLTSCCCP